MPSDIKLFVNYIEWFFKFLQINKIIVIGPQKLENALPKGFDVSFIDENCLIPFSSLRHLFELRTTDPHALNRIGWYYQQFLKMAYANICDDEYYLLWDSDTIPLRGINLFDVNGRPILDYKTEYNKTYFETIEKILPGYEKEFAYSFISEHMLVNTHHMRELLKSIESNQTISGSTFYEKIINAIDIKSLAESGFSEFETYGTYIFKQYKETYTTRYWKSMRFGGFFYPKSVLLSETQRKWLGRHYHAITFEKKDNLSFLSHIVSLPLFLFLFSPICLNVLSFIPRIVRKCRK